MEHGRIRLRAWLTRSKLNQTKAARLLSISDVFLSQILAGDRTPALATAIRIQDVTGVPVESWAQTASSGTDPETPESSGNAIVSK